MKEAAGRRENIMETWLLYIYIYIYIYMYVYLRNVDTFQASRAKQQNLCPTAV
jgi:hypothetical protein